MKKCNILTFQRKLRRKDWQIEPEVQSYPLILRPGADFQPPVKFLGKENYMAQAEYDAPLGTLRGEINLNEVWKKMKPRGRQSRDRAGEVVSEKHLQSQK